MRVISGVARGIPLIGPKGGPVRPTSDRVREALFNILSPCISGCDFIDLYAGTGANGIEALSRGAKSCQFVDSKPQALDVVRMNLEKTRLSPMGKCVLGRIPSCLNLLSPADIVFADPPYHDTDMDVLCTGLHDNRILRTEGMLVLEHDPGYMYETLVNGFTHEQTRKYGSTALSFFRYRA